MKGNVRVKKIIGIVLIVVLALTTKAYAANDSFKTTLQSSSSNVQRNKEVTVTIGISDISIESGDKGIGAYTAKVDFDSSVLEYVSTSGTDNWEAPTYQNGLIVGNTKNGEVAKTAQSIGTITFKAKEGAKLGDTTIKLTTFSGSTAENDVTAKDTTIKITVVDSNGNSVSGGTSNNGSQTSGSGNTSGNTSGSGSSSTTTTNGSNEKPGKLPQTGDVDTVVVTLISIFALASIVVFTKMKLLDRKIKKL